MRRIDLLAIDDVADGEMKMVVVDGTDQVLVINNGGEFTAVQGVCSHEYFELDKGFLTAGTLTCALHLSRFDLSDGEPLDPPAELPLEVYPVVVEDGRVLIEVGDSPRANPASRSQRSGERLAPGCRPWTRSGSAGSGGASTPPRLAAG
jgi:3-phenylpropionate/trans-cinnamate dioxygenase ferredoxin subunit